MKPSKALRDAVAMSVYRNALCLAKAVYHHEARNLPADSGQGKKLWH